MSIELVEVEDGVASMTRICIADNLLGPWGAGRVGANAIQKICADEDYFPLTSEGIN